MGIIFKWEIVKWGDDPTPFLHCYPVDGDGKDLGLDLSIEQIEGCFIGYIEVWGNLDFKSREDFNDEQFADLLELLQDRATEIIEQATGITSR